MKTKRMFIHYNIFISITKFNTMTHKYIFNIYQGSQLDTLIIFSTYIIIYN